tara:strand:+ start:95 stop:529 length:435 start_codon:yes stop_codon:yes gene_type:complete
MKIALATLLALTPVSTLASPVPNHSQAGYSHERSCFKTEYREEYIPGTEDSPGYVKSWKDTVEVACKDDHPDVGWRRHPSPTRPYYRRHVTVYEDTNDCSDGTAAGAILGGGLGAVLSRGEGRWWAIPTGVVTGAMLGCQIDGG